MKGLEQFGTLKPTCLWMGWDWMGYLQTGPFLDHLAVIINGRYVSLPNKTIIFVVDSSAHLIFGLNDRQY